MDGEKVINKAGFELGNKLWMLRNKHGRDKLWQEPEQFFEAALEYFEWCEANPIGRVDVVRGGDHAGAQIEAKVPRPYSMGGLCIYLDISTDTFRNYEKNEKYSDFFEVFRKVREIIDTQKMDGAYVGNYNANIVARDLGLVDKKDIESGGKPIQKNTIVFGDTEIEI